MIGDCWVDSKTGNVPDLANTCEYVPTSASWDEHRTIQRVYAEHEIEINKMIKNMYPEEFI